MGLLTKKKKGDTPDAADVPRAPSATELALIAERENTTSQAKKARKAETTYRVKRQATRARTERAAAKTHIATSFKELRSGFGAGWRAFWLLHYCLRDRMAPKQGTKERKQLERTETKRKKLEEKMKKAEAEYEKRKAEAPPEEAKEEEAAAE